MERSGIDSIIIGDRMLRDVNANLPQETQFARWARHPGKLLGFYRQYWRLGLSRRPLQRQAMLVVANLVAVLVLG